MGEKIANIEAPRDAAGREIPLDANVLYGDSGTAWNIVRWAFTTNSCHEEEWRNCRYAVTDTGGKLAPEPMYLIPPDSWEKLEEDLNRAVEETDVCLYCGKDDTCANCTVYGNTPKGGSIAAFKDILDRIRKLKGEGK